MIPDDVEFIDAENQFMPQKTVGLKDIVFNHVLKISNLCTKEFCKAYWQEKPVATAGGVFITKIRHEDTRDAYINAVDFLHDLLLPKFDTDAEKEIYNIQKELDGKNKEGMDEDYWKDEKLVYRRKIFRELSKLLKRLNYLESRAIR